jgi:hypothetical protein
MKRSTYAQMLKDVGAASPPVCKPKPTKPVRAERQSREVDQSHRLARRGGSISCASRRKDQD